jgi:hypothetical protein
MSRDMQYIGMDVHKENRSPEEVERGARVGYRVLS